jgi:hypothetical protein
MDRDGLPIENSREFLLIYKTLFRIEHEKIMCIFRICEAR